VYGGYPCGPLDSADPTADYLAAGTEVRLTRFVRGEETFAPSEARVGVIQLVGDDGSAKATDFYLVSAGRMCSTRHGDVERCIPEPIARTSTAASIPDWKDECYGVVAWPDHCAEGEVTYTLRRPGASGIFEAEPVTGTALSDLESECIAAAEHVTDGPLYRPGAEVAASTFPEFRSDWIEVGQISYAQQSNDGVVVALHPTESITTRDIPLGTNCRLWLASDSVTRCMPDGFDPQSFADEGCTIPLTPTPMDWAALSLDPVFAQHLDYRAYYSTTRVAVYERGDRHVGPVTTATTS
jgi:hypothetical protein